MINQLSNSLRRKLIYLTSLVLMLSLAGKGWSYTSNPSPADDAIYTDTWAGLEWSAGTHAVSFDIYFGENFDDVKLGTGGTFRGNQSGTFFVVGFPGFLYPNGLVPGTTYYWRIDEVNDIHPDSPWIGDVWRFTIPPSTAYNPEPADGAEDVDVDVQLSWTAGFGSVLHTVYFGESFDEVDNATSGHIQGTRTYTPGPLEFEKTYYWRVDEFDGVLSHKGDVWSFTVRAVSTELRIIYVDDDAAGVNNGKSWADGYRCLQNALADAQSGDEIRVAQGIYKPDLKEIITERGARVIRSGDRTETFQLINGVAIKGGYAGLGELEPDARDIEVYETVLSGDLNGNDGPNFAGNSENSFHVVTGNGTNETAVLDGFTITAGNANGTDWESQGGGMFNQSGSPTVTNCTFENNSSTRSGGGMSNYNSSPTLTNCVFSRNLTNNNGGGILCHGASSPTITNCTISENTAGFWGGGIECDDSSPTIVNCTISGNVASVAPNSATGGGGIQCIDSSPTIIDCTISDNTTGSGTTDSGGIGCMRSSPTIINCTISNNTSTHSAGGIGCYRNSSPTITDCIITDNTTEQAGGGIYCYRDSFAIITNNIITGNSAGRGNGGGIMCWDNSSPSITNNIIMENSARFGGGINCNRNCSPSIINNIIVGNSADDQGGGIYCGDSSPDIINNTIIRNWATWGGGIYSGGDDSFPTIINTIFWMDSPQEIYLHVGGSVAVTYCCVRGGWTGAGNINADPLFVDAANSDYHLQAGSPCIDAGDNSAIPPSVVEDFDGNPRITDGIVDMGAYEFERPPLHLRASNPSPADGAIDVSQTPTLRWNAGERASLHDVYFGTDEQAVRNASIRSPEYKGTKGLGSESFEPGKLERNTTYYWRIDEYNTDETINEGKVWSFTVVDVVVDPLAEALDTDLSFTTGGNADWFSQTRRWYHDGNAVQSGEITHDQDSWLQTTVNGAGTVSFYWKVSSEENYDCLEFYIDGTLEDQISGSKDWHDMTYEITGSALHTLEWRYFKDGSMSRGEDCGWVDKVEWVSN